jgi:hypothetical protein
VDDENNKTELTLPSRLTKRLLDSGTWLDYLWVALFGAWPVLCARLIGAHDDLNGYDGYWSTPSWYSFAATLPAALLLLRWSMNQIAPVQAMPPGDDPARLPPIIQLIDSPQGRLDAYECLRKTMLSGANLMLVVGLVLLFHVFDMREVITVYLTGSVETAEELDWSIMFAGTDIPRGQNLILVVSAYAVQFAVLTTLILFAVLIARHNWFFLNRVYQRRRVPEEEAPACIIIDLDDVDLCFGFRRANKAFTVQVLLLAAIAIALLVSRFVNVDRSGELYSDFGQVVQVIGGFAGFIVVTLPMWVKVLPFRHAGARRSIVNYLREFFPKRRWPYGESPDRQVIETLAARFAANAFWPTGNNRAAYLFLLSFFALCFLSVPNLGVLLEGPGWRSGLADVPWIIPASAILYLVIAFAFTGGLLWLFRIVLRYVDTRLVDPPDGPVMTIKELNESLGVETEKSAHRLFISYRRQDSAAYAGRLKENLEKRFYADNVFFDLHGIAAGDDFVDVIEEKIAISDVMLVVIGPQWLSAVDDDGNPRLGSNNDYVTVEIATALRHELEIIPVLVGGTDMPKREQLPEVIVGLARKNAAEISDSRWSYDVQEVVDAILQRELTT